MGIQAFRSNQTYSRQTFSKQVPGLFSFIPDRKASGLSVCALTFIYMQVCTRLRRTACYGLCGRRSGHPSQSGARLGIDIGSRFNVWESLAAATTCATPAPAFAYNSEQAGACIKGRTAGLVAESMSNCQWSSDSARHLDFHYSSLCRQAFRASRSG
ncbi:hypothetical protein K437DRAFT_134598 [Tilletiaria anomala UBC 951]|uniref:Uncharacterized protein n=1 Tax=Tilletiaria anomala (strain ATCC 24038 / CBS 436.72 / UBC 951) TaxID=1037660 RepID=A0A066WK94_TILAU|nr:uncharacterized protein K437DRAFT_134598 [Tilletiaria anomala UBC 951]KDN52988.1 hypothetical protein K437DRAFT_134598 [Tilletiaria anomala UBC 951]